jgi:GNAT superfamily N-acetyltransferase
VVENEITIRTAEPCDAEIIAYQRRAMFDAIKGPLDPADLAAMDATFVPYVRRALADGSYRGWLACLGDGRVVAGGGAIVYEWPASPGKPETHRAYVLNVYTEPAYRRRGIARRIVETIVGWCRANGLNNISLHASTYGRSLYASLGFEPTNEMRLWVDA